ncbi:MAG TPA: ABC transporter permease subunit [Candidatus Butyricicoccus stercorigallinarum]|nr:ABC transporter permease subunit [Candidatus Butyricicoccus stercorigallinarum]
MNFPLFRYSCKRAFPLWLVFTALMCAYTFAVVRMYDPVAGAALTELAASLPQTMTVLGMASYDNTFTAFIVNYLYGMLMLALPMLFTILLSTQLMARHIARGTMCYLLASPNSRKTIAATQRNVLLFYLFLMLALCCGATVVLCEYFYPGQLAVRHFLLLTACVFALQLALASVCFFFSCKCSGTGRAMTCSAAACLLFYTLRLLANLGGPLEYLRYVTPYTLLDPAGILQSDLRACLLPLVLLVLAVALFALASRTFRKRTMPF